MFRSSPGKNTTVRRESVFVDSADFRSNLRNFYEKGNLCLVIKIWQILSLKTLMGRRVVLHIQHDH